jgi:chromosome segregation ATPase
VPTSRTIEIPDPPQHEKAIAMLAQRLSRLESQFLQFQTSNVSLHPPELPTRTDHSTSAVQIAAMDVRMSKLETLLGQVSQRLQTLEETRVQAVWTEITRFENASHEYLNGMRVDVDARLKSMDEHVLRCHAAVQRFEETMGQLMVRQYEFERAVRQSLTQFEYSSMAQQEKRASGSMGSPGAGRP